MFCKREAALTYITHLRTNLLFTVKTLFHQHPTRSCIRMCLTGLCLDTDCISFKQSQRLLFFLLFFFLILLPAKQCRALQSVHSQELEQEALIKKERNTWNIVCCWLTCWRAEGVSVIQHIFSAHISDLKLIFQLLQDNKESKRWSAAQKKK